MCFFSSVPEHLACTIDISHNNLNKLIYIKITEWLGNLRVLNINDSTHIDFIKLCPIEQLYHQSISTVEIKYKFPSLKSIPISSRGMSIEHQMQIIYDCTRYDVHIRMGYE